MEPNLDAKITSINTRGEVTIMFSKEVNFTSNLTLFRAKEAFSAGDRVQGGIETEHGD
jgi:hypothetical protein